MQFQTPTISNLVGAAIKAATDRTELLILLSLLTGLVSSILYEPAIRVLTDLLTALETAPEGTTDYQVSRILENGFSTLLFSHLTVTAVSTFLLVPWARASAPGSLLPNEGGGKAFMVRGVRSFLHILAASGISALVMIILMPIIGFVSASLGPIGLVISMALICVAIWLSFAITATANLAIAAEARDRQETLWSAFTRARLFMAPIAGSLALIFLTMMFLHLTVGTLFLALVPDPVLSRVGGIISGAVVYAISALHVAALYVVPDFRDLRPF